MRPYRKIWILGVALASAAGATPASDAGVHWPSRLSRFRLARKAWAAGDQEEARRQYAEAARLPGWVSGDLARAVERLNYHRYQAMVCPVMPLRAATRAAEAHARYLARTTGPGPLTLEEAHGETPGTYGFTGADPGARLAKEGLVGGSAEVVTSALDPVEAVDMNAHSVYHRLAILHPRARYAGFAAESRAVIDLFWEQEDLAEVEFAVYPGHGQLEVPPRFHRVEVPDPLPDHAYPVGPPLHVWAPGVQLEKASLSGPGLTGELLTLHRGNAPMGGALADSVFLIPPAPLLPGQAYQAELRFRSGRKSWTRRFGFGVGRLAPGEVEVRLGQLRWEAVGRRITVTAEASSSRPEAPHLRWTHAGQVLQEGPATSLEWEAPRGTSTLEVLAYDPTYSDAYAQAELTLTTR